MNGDGAAKMLASGICTSCIFPADAAEGSGKVAERPLSRVSGGRMMVREGDAYLGEQET